MKFLLKKSRSKLGILLFLIIFGLSFGLSGSQQASAASAYCYSNLGGGAVPCTEGFFASQGAKQNITYQADHCYQDVNFGGTLVVAEGDCTKAPFINSVKCYSNLGGGMVPCTEGFFATQGAKQNIKYAGGHCYQDVNFGGTLVVAEADCSKSPFVTQRSVTCADGQIHNGTGTPEEICKSFGGVQPDKRKAGECNTAGDICGFFDKYINPAIKFFSIGIGVIATITIIVAGIEYSSSGGDPQKAAAAKQKIFNAVIALVAFALFFGFMQWLIPGGVI